MSTGELSMLLHLDTCNISIGAVFASFKGKWVKKGQFFSRKPWIICERDCGLFRLSSKLILWMWTSSRQQCIICFRCLYSLGFEDNYKHKLGPPTLPDTHIAGERCQVQLHLFSPGQSPGTGQGWWSSWQYSLEIFGVISQDTSTYHWH